MLQRGMWQFQVGGPQHVKLDNGNSYDIPELHKLVQDKNDLLKGRKAAMEYKETASK